MGAKQIEGVTAAIKNDIINHSQFTFTADPAPATSGEIPTIPAEPLITTGLSRRFYDYINTQNTPLPILEELMKNRTIVGPARTDVGSEFLPGFDLTTFPPWILAIFSAFIAMLLLRRRGGQSSKANPA